MAEAIGCDIAIDLEGSTEEYIEFRSVDRTMADEFGFVPSIPFQEGFRRLAAFVAEHQDAAVRG